MRKRVLRWTALCLVLLSVYAAALTIERRADARRSHFSSNEDFRNYVVEKGMYWCSERGDETGHIWSSMYVSDRPLSAEDVRRFRDHDESTWGGVVRCSGVYTQRPADYVPYRTCGKIHLTGDQSLMSRLVR